MSFFTPFAFVNQVSTIANDPDAQNFINATGISGATATAINTLVLSLKNDGIFSKLYALYPFVGTTSGSQSYNLINTGSNQMLWSGGMSFSVSGAAGNGSNAYGNTQFPNGTWPQNSLMSGFIQATANTPAKTEEILVGYYREGYMSVQLATNFGPTTPATYFVRAGQAGGGQKSGTNTGGAIGYFMVTRTNAASGSYIRNSTVLRTIDGSYTRDSGSTEPVFFFTFNSNGSVYTNSYANQRLTAGFIGSGFTLTESDLLSGSLVTFNNSLGR